jgi:hypothetical protein
VAIVAVKINHSWSCRDAADAMSLEIDNDDDDRKSDDHEEKEEKQRNVDFSEEILSATSDWTMSIAIGCLVVSFWRVSLLFGMKNGRSDRI